MEYETSNDLVRYLENEPSERGELDELVQRFCEMLAAEEFKFPIFCFYETQRTDFTKVIRNLPPEFLKLLDSDKKGIVSSPLLSTNFILSPRSLSMKIQLAFQDHAGSGWMLDTLC